MDTVKKYTKIVKKYTKYTRARCYNGAGCIIPAIPAPGALPVSAYAK